MRKKLLPTLGLLAAALAGPAAAAEYQLLLIEPEAELASRTDSGPAGQAYWAAYDRFGRELAAAGVLRGGAALQPGAATTLSLVARQPHHAPLPAAGARPGGWFVIDVPTLDEALAWAARSPAALQGGRVEVRALAIVPGMAR